MNVIVYIKSTIITWLYEITFEIYIVYRRCRGKVAYVHFLRNFFLVKNPEKHYVKHATNILDAKIDLYPY